MFPHVKSDWSLNIVGIESDQFRILGATALRCAHTFRSRARDAQQRNTSNTADPG